MRPARRLAVLGSTGSIGRQALDVASRYPDRFAVVGLSAGNDAQGLLAQAVTYPGALCALAAGELPSAVGATVPGRGGAGWIAGPDAALRLVERQRPELVVNAIAGLAGLAPALAALVPGTTVAMASKEPMVAAGEHLLAVARARGAVLYPVDSETTAVAQCLARARLEDVTRIHITASGGPLWGRDPATFAVVQPDEAVRHPRWSMGRKISVDSATLFNKGLEVIEVSRFFGLPLAQVGILVHRQAAVHALVEFTDGSLLAQLGPADMRIPIAQAMFWPERPPDTPVRLDLHAGHFDFERPELGPWPCLRAALAAGADGGTAPAALSAADEVLVRSFLAGSIGFNDIARGLWATLRAHRSEAPQRDDGNQAPDRQGGAGLADTAWLDPVLRADAWAREFAAAWIGAEGRGAPGIAPQDIGEDCR